MEPETKLNSKKLARLENKKKKMMAFLEIAKLNDADRLQKPSIKSDDSEDEPSSKKLKTEDYCHENTDENNTIRSENLTEEMTDKKSVIGKPALTGEDYERLRKELKERKKMYKNFPAFKLKTVGEEASISVDVDDRTPIFLSDIQNLILYALVGNAISYCPQRWCTFERHSKLKHTIVFVVENLSLLDYQNYESLFPNLNSNFPNKLEIITPSVYKGDLIEEIAAVPLTTTLKEKLILEYGSLEHALDSAKVFKMLKAVFPVHELSKQILSDKKRLPDSDKFPRTHLLLSAWQLVEESYPIPIKGTLKRKYSNYVMTKDVYSEVTDHSPLFALDCEMCRTTSGELELTRISVVNEKHVLIYEKLVKPYNKITDYLTQFSGITAGILKNVTTRIEEVQKDLRDLLPSDAILVGQSLNSDLHALKLIHPYIIDTSIIFNVTGDRHRKTKLKVLAKEFLDISIQTGNSGHNSVEDSLSSLKLVQLKLRNYIEYGDAVLSGQKGCLKNFRVQGDNYYGTSLLHHVTKSDKKAVIISKKADMSRYSAFIHKKEVKCNKLTCIEKETNKQIIKQLRESSKHFDITLAHVSLAEEEVTEETIEETCKTVDKYVQRIWQHCPLNTLCVVLFGGDLKSNGAGFINIRKDVHK